MFQYQLQLQKLRLLTINDVHHHNNIPPPYMVIKPLLVVQFRRRFAVTSAEQICSQLNNKEWFAECMDIFEASRKGIDKDECAKLIKGPVLSSKDKFGQSPLHIAAFEGYLLVLSSFFSNIAQDIMTLWPCI